MGEEFPSGVFFVPLDATEDSEEAVFQKLLFSLALTPNDAPELKDLEAWTDS